MTRVAIVGAGYTATEHARAFRDVPGVELVGIQSRTRGRAEALAAANGIPLVCDSIDELQERTRADLVVVTVNELSMNAVSRACFAHPWTVLLEKPAGYNLVDGESIAAAARAARRNVFVALNRRFIGPTMQTRSDLDAVDAPRFIKVQDQESQAEARQLGKPKEVVDFWMYANAIHLVDYLRVFGRGRVTKVTPVIPWNAANPGVVVARVDFESGDVGLYEGLWHAPGPWAVSVAVPERRWEMRPLERLETRRFGERPVACEPAPLDQAFKPGFRIQAEEVVKAARGEPSRAVTIDDALETMRLVDAIFPSPASDA